MDPPPLAAGERGNRCLPVDVGNQSGDDVANPGIAGPFVVGALADQFPTDRAGFVEGVGLVEGSDSQAGPPGDAASDSG